MWLFLGHGQFSDKLYDQVLSTCGVAQLKQGVTDKACSALLDKVEKEIGGYYGYNLYVSRLHQASLCSFMDRFACCLQYVQSFSFS
jgi:hypothetical protein